ncbi:Rieske 2Fe-2S domain-containing protein [Aminobacter aganoensis]|uniref:Vanillate O-demethylase monooxygenase subunit n=1 Tax=Aminobacter aganoensis TaxID=83264 RepID=A0A7X0KKH9_9HYPH|nr:MULTISPECIES: aromatic ring-hydroxylating dioxygenase subunit alpha [Aminobacter]KQU73692.1 (2Fe-2S)-binding protein [Aminobacter sp. DSM 101952]MBB6354001.1 vanillate O-demethylase monooxygenase subunit [Aminobacter aganoensis]
MLNNEPRSPAPHENPTYRALRHFWHPVCYSHEIVDKPHGVQLMGEKIVVARLGSDLVAMQDRCPHKGAALSLGQVVDCKLECPYHGWQFDQQGDCVRIPAREEMASVMNRKVRKYHATESAGMIWVCLADEPKYAPPEFSELDDGEYRVLRGNSYDWSTSTPRRLENFVDFAHFAFVHDGTIGSRENPRVEAVKVWREDNVMRFDRSGVKEPGVGKKKELLGLTDDWIEPTNVYHVTMPHTVHLKRIFPNGKRYVLFMAASPVDATTTRSFWWQARDFGTEAEHDAFFMDFEDEVLAEDKPIIESQTPIQMDLAGELARQEMPVRHADIVSVEYRRWLLELTNELANV